MTFLRTAVVAALLWSSAAAAQSGGNIYLSQAKVFFQGLNFEKCLQRLDQASRWQDSTHAELAEVELYTGLCQFSLGQRTEAEEHFKLALQIEPTLQLPMGLSPRIVESFDAVAARVRPIAAAREEARAEANQSPTQPTTTDAPRPFVTVPAPSNTAASAVNPALAASPRSHSKVLPITLGGASVAAAIAGGIFGNLAKSYEQQYNDRTTYYADAQSAARNANNSAVAANVAFGLAATAAVGAVTTLVLDL